MVINNYKGGQLANRVLSFGHLLASSIEHQYKLYNPEFDEYNQFFEGPSKNKFNNYPISITLFNNHFADRVFSRLFRLWADITHHLFSRTPFYLLVRIFKTHDKKGLIFDLNDPAFIIAAQTKTVITQGWLFRDYVNYNKYQDEIRQFFTPVEKYKLEVKKIMDELRMQADIVIGVHIRRGDYIRYAGGRYFYEDEIYADKMLQIQKIFAAKGKRCAFIICTNGAINTNNFPPELNICTGNRHFITDLYCLAACNVIIGPPSTFSIWASFYGKIPLTQINSKEEQMQLGEYVNLC